MELNIAPLRYRTVFRQGGGPIDRLEVGGESSPRGLKHFSARAFLLPSLRPAWYDVPQLYGNVDGGGTHRLRSSACFIAISEALDRWAFFAEADGPRKSALGFDIEPSTTGLAAFPSLSSRPARKRARLEAAERWGLIEWWLGRLPARVIKGPDSSEGVLELLSPFTDCTLAVCWRACSFGGLAFGFAAGTALKDAVEHARVEQGRNITVLEELFRDRKISPDVFALSGLRLPGERRLVFFASKAGARLFNERLEASCRLSRLPDMPRTLVDAELRGPWTKWATVWRVLYEQSNYDHQDETRNDFFVF